MAKTLKDFTIKRQGRTGEQHDWDTYLDGQVHELEAGKDFKVKLTTFRTAAAAAAKAKGGKIQTRVDAEKGVIQIKYVKK